MAHLSDTPNLIHHGPPGDYVKSEADLAAEFKWWLEACREHDDNPEGWLSRRREAAEAAIAAENRRRRHRS